MTKKKTTAKKSTVKKKASPKKIIKKQKTKSTAVVPVTVDASELLQAQTYKGDYSLIPTPLNPRQLAQIIAPTDKKFIKERKGKGGGMWKYLDGHWFRKKLNFTFGFLTDFDIISERVDGDFITVKGKITVKHPKTFKPMIEKTDFGGHPITYLKNKPHTPANYLDFPNDMKAAATDSLKRCCVQIGFAMDVYGGNEIAQNGHQTPPTTPNQPVYQKTHQKPATAQDTSKTVHQTTKVSHMGQLKDKLHKMGAKDTKQALTLLEKKTGMVWKDFNNKTARQVQLALTNLLNK